MSDKHNKSDKKPCLDVSRRRFLGNAGVVVAGVAALAVVPDVAGQKLTERPKAFVSDVDCDCGTESAIPLMSAAMFRGQYFGLASPESGPGLFSLNTDKAQRVTLGSQLKIDLPEGFVFASLGVVNDQLILCGSLPFLLESYEVDYEMSDDVRALMSDIPPGLPTSGKGRIDVTGLEPAVFIVNPPYTEILSLPAMPKRSFAIATAVTETENGGFAVMIEHSDGVNESRYASAVDVLEEQRGQWVRWSAGKNLGESGPNYLTISGDEIAVGINTMYQSSRLVKPKQELSSETLSNIAANRILSLVSCEGGFAALTKDGSNARVWFSTLEGRWADGGTKHINRDEIVDAVTVGGTKGQVILIGRHAARLINMNTTVLGRKSGGDTNVM